MEAPQETSDWGRASFIWACRAGVVMELRDVSIPSMRPSVSDRRSTAARRRESVARLYGLRPDQVVTVVNHDPGQGIEVPV